MPVLQHTVADVVQGGKVELDELSDGNNDERLLEVDEEHGDWERRPAFDR